ncbi:hypothetical protein BJ742DRAFT_785003 [Cladochytrium replicatum]|nr:hypothetical protein BJ742DRAFT_785003 [Cladochytrium replicatum]
MDPTEFFSSLEVVLSSNFVELTSPCFVRGHIRAKAKKQILVNSLLKASVKLSGVAKGRHARESETEGHVKFERSILRLETDTIFVDEEGRDIHELQLGSHTFPFNFMLENGSVLPPSFSFDGLSVGYTVEFLLDGAYAIGKEIPVLFVPSSRLSNNLLTSQTTANLTNRGSSDNLYGPSSSKATPAGSSKGFKNLFRIKQKNSSSGVEVVEEQLFYDLTLNQGTVISGRQISADLSWEFSGNSSSRLERILVQLIQVASVQTVGAGQPSLSTFKHRATVFATSISAQGSQITIPISIPPTTVPSIEADPVSCECILHIELIPDSASRIKPVSIDTPIIVVSQAIRTSSAKVTELAQAEYVDIKTYIEKHELSRIDSKLEASGTSSSSSTPDKQFVAVIAYSAQREDELELSVGNIVTLKAAFDDGYCFVELVDVNKQQLKGTLGFVPKYTIEERDVESREQPPRYLALTPHDSPTQVSGQSGTNRFTAFTGKVPPIIQPLESLDQPVSVDRCVSVETVAAHLGLLHRFEALTQQVKAGSLYVNAATSSIGVPPIGGNETPEVRDWVFYCRAEIRYFKWLQILKLRYFGKGMGYDNTELILPPIDVALFWHAHILNPLRYYEDTYRIFGVEQNHIEFPLVEMHSLPGLGYNPPEHHQQLWVTHTNGQEPFNLLTSDNVSPIHFACPKCNLESAFEPVQYATFRMRQGRLQCKDNRCNHSFTIDSLSVKYFLNDITKYVNERSGALKGSILSFSTAQIDLEEAQRCLDQLFRADVPHGTEENIYIKAAVSQIMKYGWSEADPNWEGAIALFTKGLRPAIRAAEDKRSTPQMFTPRLIKAYRNIPFKDLSLDLIAAVVRQRGFSAKMVSGVVDWSKESTFIRATVRYHKFMMLIAKHKRETFVPTLDLDLAWHTHQLFPARYQNYGLQNIGLIVNHDDSIDDDSLSSGYNNTSKHWKTDFGDEYAQDPPRSANPLANATTRFPAYARFASSKSTSDKKKATVSSKGGACTFYDSNVSVKKLREKGEIGHYDKKGKCTVCGTYVLLTCGGLAGDWGAYGIGKMVGGEYKGACGGSTNVGSPSLLCGTRTVHQIKGLKWAGTDGIDAIGGI